MKLTSQCAFIYFSFCLFWLQHETHVHKNCILIIITFISWTSLFPSSHNIQFTCAYTYCIPTDAYTYWCTSMLYAPTYALPCCMHLLMHFNAVCKYLCSSMLYASPGALPCRIHQLMHFHAGCTYWCTSTLEQPTDALPCWRNLLMHIHAGGTYLEATWWAYGKYIITLLWLYPFTFMNLFVFLNWKCGAYNTI